MAFDDTKVESAVAHVIVTVAIALFTPIYRGLGFGAVPAVCMAAGTGVSIVAALLLRSWVFDARGHSHKNQTLAKASGGEGEDAPQPASAFDANDPFHVHAYIMLGFCCSECDCDLELHTAAEMPSDEWCVDAATEARTAGWCFVKEKCLCPRCARKHLSAIDPQAGRAN